MKYEIIDAKSNNVSEVEEPQIYVNINNKLGHKQMYGMRSIGLNTSKTLQIKQSRELRYIQVKIIVHIVLSCNIAAMYVTHTIRSRCPVLLHINYTVIAHDIFPVMDLNNFVIFQENGQ